jgi:glycosyltransferase involved in cell wall biosynthesis
MGGQSSVVSGPPSAVQRAACSDAVESAPLIANVGCRRRPTALMIGAAPPPYHGSIMMFWTLMASSLRDHFRLLHLDISDHRSLENIGRLDVENIRLGVRHALECYRILKRERPEIVYVPIAWNPLAFFRDSLFLLLARCFGRRQKTIRRGQRAEEMIPSFKCVVHVHGGHFDDFYRGCPAPLRAYIRWCLQAVDAAVVHSEALMPMLAGLVPRERVWPVPNGIEGVPEHLRRPGPGPAPDGAPARRRERTPTILYLGSLTDAKGFLDVMQAAPLVARAIPGARFVIAGPYFRPSDRAQAERLLQDPEIRAVVELPGVVTGDARFELMLDADIFVFPSYSEGQPTVLLEAMSVGLPVVTTDEGAIRDTIAAGETGYLVPKGNPEAVALRVIELLRDEPLRRKMGEAGRRRFEERFRVENYGLGIARVFKAVLREKVDGSDSRR